MTRQENTGTFSLSGMFKFIFILNICQTNCLELASSAQLSAPQSQSQSQSEQELVLVFALYTVKLSVGFLVRFIYFSNQLK